MCSDTNKGSEVIRPKNESTEQLDDFELFGNICVRIRTQLRIIESKNADYTWHSTENFHTEFIVLLDDSVELTISINEVKTFVEGQNVKKREMPQILQVKNFCGDIS
jgi:hypothetical protein